MNLVTLHSVDKPADKSVGKRVSKSRQQGFTLLEIMVVVLILGMSLSVVSLTVGGDDGASLTRKATEEFMLTTNFVAEQTVLNSQIIGLFIEPRPVPDSVDMQWCYRWQLRRDNAWQQASETLKDQCLSPRIQLEMIVENEPYEYDPDLTPNPPVLVFYPSGESTPFEMAMFESADGFAEQDSTQRIEIDMMGKIRWLNREEEEAEFAELNAARR